MIILEVPISVHVAGRCCNVRQAWYQWYARMAKMHDIVEGQPQNWTRKEQSEWQWRHRTLRCVRMVRQHRIVAGTIMQYRTSTAFCAIMGEQHDRKCVRANLHYCKQRNKTPGRVQEGMCLAMMAHPQACNIARCRQHVEHTLLQLKCAKSVIHGCVWRHCCSMACL